MNKTILFFIGGPTGTHAVVDVGDPISVTEIHGTVQAGKMIRGTMPSDGDDVFNNFAYIIVTKKVTPPAEGCAV